MARLNKIYQGPAQDATPQTINAITAAAIAPGSVVFRNASGQMAAFATANGGEDIQLFIAQEAYTQGLNVDDDIPSGDTGTALRLEDDKMYAVLLLTGTNITAKGTPLAQSTTAGVLDIGTPGTDHIIAYAEEIYNNNTGSSQLVLVRPA